MDSGVNAERMAVVGSVPVKGVSGVVERHPTNGAAKILVVDDTAANLLALEAILEPLGHESVCAASGQEAIKLVHEHDFAVILMDVQMPGLDGFKTAAVIKERERSRHVPVIFVTAISRDAEHVFRGYEHGAVDYLLKPFDPEILRYKVAVFVDLYRKGEEIRRQAELLRAHENEMREREKLFERERQARREAEASIAIREHILAVVSHDLKSPLHAIFASAALLNRQLPKGTTGSSIQRQAAVIERAAERMNRLINDLLDVTRIEGNRLMVDRQRQSVDQLLGQVVEALQPVAAEKQQRIAVEIDRAGAPPGADSSRVYCDKDRIHQVFGNLVGNAMKFAPPGSQLRLSATWLGPYIRFGVRDDGPGISPTELPHIFDRYWQADPTKRQGLGLGLAIAKGIVAAHGGRIWAESTVGQGTSLFFELPIDPPQ